MFFIMIALLLNFTNSGRINLLWAGCATLENKDTHKGLHHILDKNIISCDMFQIPCCISVVAKNFVSSPLGSHLSKMLVNQQSTRSCRSTGPLTAQTSEVSLNAISNFLSKDYGI